MNYFEETEAISRLMSSSPIIFLTTEPEVFSSTDSFILNYYTNKDFVSVNVTKHSSRVLGGLLKACVLNKNNIIICWNIKNLFTYLRANLSEEYYLPKFLDLKVLEAYFDRRLEKPSSFNEALHRLSLIDKDFIKGIYKNISLNLIQRVIPAIESCGLVDLSSKKIVYPYYEIEGQDNGRMKCFKTSSRNYNPHKLSSEVKENLKLISDDEVFIYLDFKNMEVAVLSILSKDPILKEIINSSSDVYEAIYEKITNNPCNNETRSLCKSIFLPIMFGMQPRAIAEKLGISYGEAVELLDKIRKTFRVAIEWIESWQEKEGEVKDIFGRIRIFDGKSHVARNFAVQSPASLICLDKLVELYNSLNRAKLCFSVHDGYVLSTKLNESLPIALNCVKILETNSKLLPELKLKVTCKIGKKLNRMKGINEYI